MGDCLRSSLWRNPTAQVLQSPCWVMVNLQYAAARPLTTQCAQYRSAQPQRFARGLTHLFDGVPRGVYPALRADVERIFSSRRTYFYCRKGMLLVSPAEQHAIAQAFAQHGVDEPPRYDGYEDCCAWD